MIISYLLEHNRYLNLVGILVILLIAFIFSKHKSKISYKLVINALIMQFVIGFLLLKTGGSAGNPGDNVILSSIAGVIEKVYSFADEGSKFLFCNLADCDTAWGFVFGIKVLPIIIFFGALMSLLFYF